MLTPITSENQARDLFDSGYFCAESVLMAIARQSGIESPLIPRIATGFCGGISRTSGLCGALTGGIMALSLIYGRDLPTDSRDTNYSLVQRFLDTFVREFGSMNCSDILGCDISTPQGSRQFASENLESSICANVTARAAGMVTEIINAHVDEDSSLTAAG
ncbi:MAG: C-GCAxxG-C-C family protein [Pseudomonadota bacterium]